MKKVLTYLFLIAIFFNSCESNESTAPETCEDSMECEDNCLFTVFNQIGVVSYVPCYDTWGIYYKVDISQENEELALVINMPEDYKVEDKEVIFSAAFFDNDIPFLFPDPPGASNFKMELCDMQEQN